MDYKSTIKLPETAFPMKADLAKREPEFIARWEAERVYERLLEQNRAGERFVFHDGPPYANGSIHHGHILNKVLQDIVVKHRSLKGRYVRYVPGWDCHGLPIEIAAEKELGKPADAADKLSIRKRCHEFAMKWSAHQMDQFKRLGLFSVWNEPYRTLTPGYEKTIVDCLATIVEKGLVYRGRKPVYWCASCRTALAEAEVEYHDHASPSVYVMYETIDRARFHELLGLDDDGTPLAIMIWTTTPWTLPASLVIAMHPRYQYRAYRVDGRRVIIAEEMAGPVFDACGKPGEPLGRAVLGEALERLRAHHPFIDREIPILLADYVTLDAGTGCVHTAPGHGQEDYVLCAQHGIDVYAPVDAEGRFEADVPRWAGMKVWDANPVIVQFLADHGVLLNPPGQKLQHQYPACWRCKQPIIFRATPQWFISMERGGLRETALAEIERTRWIPPWGRDRIHGMVENRPDWCISRQRVWGVPLPFFTCEECGEPVVDAGIIRHVGELIGRDGSDVWFARSAAELLPPGARCGRCGCGKLAKEENIVDVWFESGVSWAAVCRDAPGLGLPIDLYLEGADQHRGWFHTALLTGVGTMDKAPYRAVLTHGFICNEKGEILSKSQKNFVPPDKTINQEGAEILRLWVAYEDYRSDIAFSPDIIKSLVDSYRKIRNTFRYMLGNLSGFDPTRDALPFTAATELDRWMLGRFGRYLTRVDQAYEEYDFHRVFHDTIEFVTNDLSAFYFDVLKDRLYCESPHGTIRRSAQTVLYVMARDLARALAPVLSFTAEEVWRHLPPSASHPDSVFLAGFPAAEAAWNDEPLAERWTVLRDVRKIVTKTLEAERQAGRIGNALEARVTLGASGALLEQLQALGEVALAELFLVSELKLVSVSGEPEVTATRNEDAKCPRCWRRGNGLGQEARFPELCRRCATVLAELADRNELPADK